MSNRRPRLKVFLCHDSSDKPRVRSLYRRLAADGVEAWLDEEKLLPGQDWHAEISKAVRAADIVVICLSNQSITKEGYVQREMKFALDVAEEKPESSIFIIPARLEDCIVPERMKRWQWVDLFSEGGYEKLMKSLRSRADNVNVTIGKSRERKSLRQERVLEAVIENRIVVKKPVTLSVWIKRLASKSIISVVRPGDAEVISDADNVKSKSLEIELPNKDGHILPAAISLKLTVPDFSPATQTKKINIPPDGGSEIYKFIITPKKTGTFFLRLELLKDGVSLVTRTLPITVVESESKGSSPLVLVSIPMAVFVRPVTERRIEIPVAAEGEPEKTEVPFLIRLIFTLVGLALLVFFVQAYLKSKALFICTPPVASAIGISVVSWLLLSLGWSTLEGPVNKIVQTLPPGQQDFRIFLTRIIILLTNLFFLGQLPKKSLMIFTVTLISGTVILWGLNQNGILYFSSPEETPQIVGFSLSSSNGAQIPSPDGKLELERGQQYLVSASHLPNDVTCNWSAGSRGVLPMEPGCAARYTVPLTVGELDSLAVQVQSACKTKSVFAGVNVKILEP
jgi:hypothetical protein